MDAARQAIETALARARDRGEVFEGLSDAAQDPSVIAAAGKMRVAEGSDPDWRPIVIELEERWRQGKLPEIAADRQALLDARADVGAAEGALAGARLRFQSDRQPTTQAAVESAHAGVLSAAAVLGAVQDSVGSAWGFCPRW
jgi:hypothetical protein